MFGQKKKLKTLDAERFTGFFSSQYYKDLTMHIVNILLYSQ